MFTQSQLPALISGRLWIWVSRLSSQHGSVNHFTVTLIHWGRVTHICANKRGHHCFRHWLFALLAPSHYSKQCWNIVNWNLRNKLQWVDRILIEIHKFSFWKCLWKCHLRITTIFSQPRCVKLESCLNIMISEISPWSTNNHAHLLNMPYKLSKFQ